MCPQLDITENFADNTVLTQAQLHKAFLDMEDFVNLVKLDEENIQAGSLTNLSLADLTITTSKYGVASITLSKLAQEITDKLVPAGAIIAYGGTVVPSGWLYCDGSAVSRTLYSALFSSIGILWGNGDGSSTFNLPDLKGRFLRGQDDGAARDPDASSRTASALGGSTGDQVGSVQADDFKIHNHTVNDPGHRHAIQMFANFLGGATTPQSNGGPYNPSTQYYTNTVGTGIYLSDTGGNETRPLNAYVRYIIKV